MSHDELSELLQSLPRQQASRSFTARTLARANEGPHPQPRLRSVFALALTFIVLLSGAIELRRHQAQVRMQQLRAERQQIQKELDQLKALSTARDPRVFIGTSGQYDFVLGLEPRSRSTGTPRPVSLHIANDGIS